MRNISNFQHINEFVQLFGYLLDLLFRFRQHKMDRIYFLGFVRRRDNAVDIISAL